MINSYSEYLKQLKEKIRKNNYQMLLDSDIDSFIGANKLDINYDITIADVKTDIKAIILKHRQQSRNRQKQNPKYNKIQNKTVKNYQQYEKLLKEYIIKNNGMRLNDSQINSFIKTYTLDRDWGITNTDVFTDMINILSRVNTNISVKNIQIETNNNTKQKDINSIENDILYHKTKLSEDDLKIVDTIIKYMNECPSVFKETKRIEALLRDIIPEKRMEVNLLSFLAKEGILSEQGLTDSSRNKLICNQYISIIKSSFGTDSLIAERMVQIWVACLEGI